MLKGEIEGFDFVELRLHLKVVVFPTELPNDLSGRLSGRRLETGYLVNGRGEPCGDQIVTMFILVYRVDMTDGVLAYSRQIP